MRDDVHQLGWEQCTPDYLKGFAAGLGGPPPDPGGAGDSKFSALSARERARLRGLARAMIGRRLAADEAHEFSELLRRKLRGKLAVDQGPTSPHEAAMHSLLEDIDPEPQPTVSSKMMDRPDGGGALDDGELHAALRELVPAEHHKTLADVLKKHLVGRHLAGDAPPPFEGRPEVGGTMTVHEMSLAPADVRRWAKDEQGRRVMVRPQRERDVAADAALRIRVEPGREPEPRHEFETKRPMATDAHLDVADDMSLVGAHIGVA